MTEGIDLISHINYLEALGQDLSLQASSARLHTDFFQTMKVFEHGINITKMEFQVNLVAGYKMD